MSSRLCELDEEFGALLRSRKADFVTSSDAGASVGQHGAARISPQDWPGWPTGLASTEPVIETFVAGPDQVEATSDNEPFVTAWMGLAKWMNVTVRASLTTIGVELAGDGYITASLTATEELEGTAHLDDDQFVPTDSVSMVAIIGELAGPRIATAPLPHGELRPMAPVIFDDATLTAFGASKLDHCAAQANELVVFPQFGQLHAGPAAHHVADLAPMRQLLVMRAPVALP